MSKDFCIYRIPLPDGNCASRQMEFYARRRNGVSEAFCLGFAPHDKPLCEETKLEQAERSAYECATRTIRLKSTLICNRNGIMADEKWECQAALVTLWRRLESLKFLKLPPNPFLGDRPARIDVIDFDQRFRTLRRYEKELPTILKKVKEKWESATHG